MVADWIDLNGRAHCGVARNDYCFIIAGGLGRSSRVYFVDEIGPSSLYPIELVIAVCIGDCGLQHHVTAIEEAAAVGVFV